MITGDATPWWEGTGALILILLICVIAFVAVFSIVYFALPKRFRAQNLRFRLPLVFGAVQAIIGLALRDVTLGHSIEGFFYFFVNAPIMPLLSSERITGWIERMSGVGDENVLATCLSVVYWMLATFLIGYWIDYRRAKKAQSVSSSLSPTPGQQP